MRRPIWWGSPNRPRSRAPSSVGPDRARVWRASKIENNIHSVTPPESFRTVDLQMATRAAFHRRCGLRTLREVAQERARRDARGDRARCKPLVLCEFSQVGWSEIGGG